MIRKANETTLNQIFSGAINFFSIPTYQREYAWTKEKCDELFSDINGQDKGYFIGSIILIDGKDETEVEVIDGQQRLTTISLLLLAIYEKLSSFNSQRDKIKDAKTDIKKILLNSKKVRLKLQKQNYNGEDYEYLLKSVLIDKNFSCQKPSNFGLRRIAKNYSYFLEQLNPMKDKECLYLLEKIKSLVFVEIRVDDNQSAFMIFEAMNNRGLALTPVDLIKNTYMSKKGGDAEKWGKLVSLLGDDYNTQEQFLRNNYNAFRKEYNYTKKIKATKSNIIKLYENLIKQEDFMDDLLNRARLYSFMSGIEEYDNESINELLAELRHAEVKTSYILVLYLFYYKGKFNLTNEQFCEIIKYILKFFVCRNLTNHPGTGVIPNILMSIIDKINCMTKVTYDELFKIIKKDLDINNEYSPSEIEKKLSGNMYLDNRALTRFLLCYLCKDELKKDKENRIDLWEKERNKDNYIWTIEHIFPEGKNVPECWVNMIADGDEERAKELLNEKCHMLGNLTMTGYNSNLSNKSFKEKKDRTKNKIKIGYNSGLPINKYVINQEKWTVENIDYRTKVIVKKVMKFLFS